MKNFLSDCRIAILKWLSRATTILMYLLGIGIPTAMIMYLFPEVSSFIVSYIYIAIGLTVFLLVDKFFLKTQERDYDFIEEIFVHRNTAAAVCFLGVCLLIGVAIWRA